MTIGIYCFINKYNKKRYIGQSFCIEKRIKDHKTRCNNMTSSMYNSSFYQALRKYGFNSFDLIILDSNDNYKKEDLNRLESFYIKKYDTYFNGYNMNYGGNSVYITHKLTIDEVKKIKYQIKTTKRSFVKIANDFNISVSLVSQINAGIIWTEVDKNNYVYPIRINTAINNVGGTNPNAKLSDEEVLELRKRFVNESLSEIYQNYKTKISFSSLKKILYGNSFKNLPIYKKNKKAWYLNGTCIDYPRLEE